ncbi:BTB POZ domain-containing protein [Rutstroemia sp. NJR-2017a BBW]|nr:BTB POZ domain-containing protein [Rutstroemia sp. NJR-2017a BBW]
MKQSPFFALLLSNALYGKQKDGSYFIDADPELFAHILRYLRRGILPIFYDNATGHNHALYGLLLEEAEYFQLPRLKNWLSEKKYLQAVTTRCWVDELEGKHFSDVRGSDEVGDYSWRWHTNRTYLCPRRIPVHKGNPKACGQLCSEARVEGVTEYEEEEVLKTLVVRKQIIVDHQACVGGRDGDDDTNDD